MVNFGFFVTLFVTFIYIDFFKNLNYQNLEGPTGFEPVLMELQSSALPLGYGPISNLLYVLNRICFTFIIITFFKH